MLPVCQFVFFPSRQSEAIETHIRNSTPGFLHHFQCLIIQFSSYFQTKKLLHFLKFFICRFSIYFPSKLIWIWLNSIEFIQIVLVKKK